MARSSEVKIAPRPAQRSVVVPRRIPAFVERITRYLREISLELSRVEWPTRRELMSMTLVVVIVLALTSLYLGLFDYVFTVLVKRYLLRPLT